MTKTTFVITLALTLTSCAGELPPEDAPGGTLTTVTLGADGSETIDVVALDPETTVGSQAQAVTVTPAPGSSPMPFCTGVLLEGPVGGVQQNPTRAHEWLCLTGVGRVELSKYPVKIRQNLVWVPAGSWAQNASGMTMVAPSLHGYLRTAQGELVAFGARVPEGAVTFRHVERAVAVMIDLGPQRTPFGGVCTSAPSACGPQKCGTAGNSCGQQVSCELECFKSPDTCTCPGVRACVGRFCNLVGSSSQPIRGRGL